MKQIKQALSEALKDLGLEEGVPQKQSIGDPCRTQAERNKQPGRLSSKLGYFAPMPYELIDLASELMKYKETRGIGRALKLVVLDLVRYTDWHYGDVIITNEGIRRRSGLGLSSIKAVISLLVKMEVLRRANPPPERLAELQRNAPGGFGPRRRYLVWNPHSEWCMPTLSTAYYDIQRLWKARRGVH